MEIDKFVKHLVASKKDRTAMIHMKKNLMKWKTGMHLFLIKKKRGPNKMATELLSTLHDKYGWMALATRDMTSRTRDMTHVTIFEKTRTKSEHIFAISRTIELSQTTTFLIKCFSFKRATKIELPKKYLYRSSLSWRIEIFIIILNACPPFPRCRKTILKTWSSLSEQRVVPSLVKSPFLPTKISTWKEQKLDIRTVVVITATSTNEWR